MTDCIRCHCAIAEEEEPRYNSLVKGFGPLCFECDKLVILSHNAARIFGGGFRESKGNPILTQMKVKK